MPTPADRPASTRYAGDRRRDAKRALYEGRYDDSWAVLIGIDHYRHYNPLRLAARDAVAMARALVEHRWFPREKVFLLVEPDEPLRPDPHAWLEPSHPDLKAWLDAARLGDRYRRGATKQQIEHVLFDELAAVKADDRVLIYFAGHGTRRPPNDRPYLVPSDARPGWWRDHIDLRDLLREGSYLRAKHVLYVLDACCAGLADSRSGEQDKPFVQKMLRRAARQCLTAGTRDQRVDDQAGRHSPFTGCLLELLGDRSETGDEAATTPEDGKALPVSTIAARLKERVGNADTSSGQHPALFSTLGDRGGEFVFSPRVAPPSPEAQAALAGQLVDDVGRLLDEPAPIQFAARLWRRIARSASVAPGEQREAKREHARAQLLLGRRRAALRELDATLDPDPEARLLRARTLLRLDQRALAAAELDELLELAPSHPYADWARLAIPVARRPPGARHALLIGVDEVASLPGSRLNGCRNDIAALWRLFLDPRLGFTTVTTLVGPAATVDAIRAQLARFASLLDREDAFVCYIIGEGYLDGERVVYPGADLDLTGDRRLTERDIDEAMRSIRAKDRLLVTDGNHLGPAEQTEPAGYRILYACRQREKRWEIRSRDGEDRGAFTHAFEKAVRTLGNASIARIMAYVRTRLSDPQRPQTPGYTGSGASRLFQSPPVELEIIELAERSHGPFATERIADFTDWLTRQDELAGAASRMPSMAPLWLALGRAWLARHAEAPDPLSRKMRLEYAIFALESARSDKALLPLVQAQLLLDQYDKALDRWTTWRSSSGTEGPGGPSSPQSLELDRLLKAWQTGERRALLVSTDLDGTAWRSHLEPAKRTLTEQFSVPAANIGVLVNAPKDAIVAAFRILAAAAQSAPAFFLFIGPGFDGAEIWLSTTDQEGRVSSNLGVAELSELAHDSAHLTAALLITHYLPPHGSFGDTAKPPATVQAELGIATLVVAPYMQRPAEDGAHVEPLPQGAADRVAPARVEQLFKLLALRGGPSLTLADWRRAFDDAQQQQQLQQQRLPVLQGSRLRGKSDVALLPYLATRDHVFELLQGVEQAALPGMLDRLKQLTSQPEDVAEAWLMIAIIEAQQGNHTRAIEAVDRSLGRDPAAPLDPLGSGRGATAGDSPEARYHRGRIQLACRKYTEAEADLRFTVDREPKHARAHYHRARAIRALLETDLEQLRRESVHAYMKNGAPFGIDGEVTELRPDPSTRTRQP